MAVLLSCSGIRKSHGSRVLFDDFSLTVSDGDRTGLIGPNGSGKTTLLEILAGNEAPDAGTSAMRKGTRFAYVAQNSVFDPDATVGGVLRAALDGLHVDEKQKSASIQVMFGRAGFESLETSAAALSGGWKKRLALAAALVARPDVLVLDEPTNQLDLDGILWLERAVLGANACLIVTHDRYFLENVATQVTEINPAYPQGSFQVKGNYSEFLEKRQDFFDAHSRQQISLASKVRREVEWLRRGPKARTGKSRARIDAAGKLMDQLSEATARSRTASAQIDFTASDRKTKRLIEAEGLGKTLGGKRLFEKLNLTLTPGMRVGLVGPNGSGKTTLLKMLQGTLQPDEGNIRRAEALRIVNFAQDRAAHLDLTITLRRALCPEGDAVVYRGRSVHVAGWAKRFLFRDEQLELPLSRLSGGEIARVLIARLMLETADLLLLDEPTNDLDIPTLEVLEESLLDFPGALVMVSHDRYLLDRVSTVVIGLNGRGEAGAFADYSQWEASRGEQVVEKPASKDRPAPVAAAESRKKLSYLEQREWDSMEQNILRAEQELARWEREVQAAASDAQRLPEAYAQLQMAQLRVEELYARWAELETKTGS
jgi:ABC transport system ATP-binding/permease protein